MRAVLGVELEVGVYGMSVLATLFPQPPLRQQLFVVPKGGRARTGVFGSLVPETDLLSTV